MPPAQGSWSTVWIQICLVVVDGDDVGWAEEEGDLVAGAWGDGCGGEWVHLGDLDWGGAFEFEEVLGGFAEVG